MAQNALTQRLFAFARAHNLPALQTTTQCQHLIESLVEAFAEPRLNPTVETMEVAVSCAESAFRILDLSTQKQALRMLTSWRLTITSGELCQMETPDGAQPSLYVELPKAIALKVQNELSLPHQSPSCDTRFCWIMLHRAALEHLLSSKMHILDILPPVVTRAVHMLLDVAVPPALQMGPHAPSSSALHGTCQTISGGGKTTSASSPTSITEDEHDTVDQTGWLWKGVKDLVTSRVASALGIAAATVGSAIIAERATADMDGSDVIATGALALSVTISMGSVLHNAWCRYTKAEEDVSHVQTEGATPTREVASNHISLEVEEGSKKREEDEEDEEDENDVRLQKFLNFLIAAAKDPTHPDHQAALDTMRFAQNMPVESLSEKIIRETFDRKKKHIQDTSAIMGTVGKKTKRHHVVVELDHLVSSAAPIVQLVGKKVLRRFDEADRDGHMADMSTWPDMMKLVLNMATRAKCMIEEGINHGKETKQANAKRLRLNQQKLIEARQQHERLRTQLQIMQAKEQKVGHGSARVSMLTPEMSNAIAWWIGKCHMAKYISRPAISRKVYEKLMRNRDAMWERNSSRIQDTSHMTKEQVATLLQGLPDTIEWSQNRGGCETHIQPQAIVNLQAQFRVWPAWKDVWIELLNVWQLWAHSPSTTPEAVNKALTATISKEWTAWLQSYFETCHERIEDLRQLLLSPSTTVDKKLALLRVHKTHQFDTCDARADTLALVQRMRERQTRQNHHAAMRRQRIDIVQQQLAEWEDSIHQYQHAHTELQNKLECEPQQHHDNTELVKKLHKQCEGGRLLTKEGRVSPSCVFAWTWDAFEQCKMKQLTKDHAIPSITADQMLTNHVNLKTIMKDFVRRYSTQHT